MNSEFKMHNVYILLKWLGAGRGYRAKSKFPSRQALIPH
jgi:hypothetical protein